MQLHKKTVYIRDEDLEAWSACPNKSLMVHTALQPATKNVFIPLYREDEPAPQILSPTNLKPRSSNTCKEGHPIPSGRSKCLGKGCKYS